MASTVHVTYHRGLRQLEIIGASQFTSDAVLALDEPALSEVTSSIDSSSSTELAAAPAKTKCARVQVEDGKTCRYKIVNESNPGETASSTSPAISGETIIHLESGWVISLLSTS